MNKVVGTNLIPLDTPDTYLGHYEPVWAMVLEIEPDIPSAADCDAVNE